MDWNFKLSSGYLSEFDRESVPELPPIDGSISFGGSSSSPRLQPKGDFSFDLKLGRNIGNSSSSSSAFGNTEQVISLGKWKEKPEASRSSASSSSSKRTRGNGIGNNNQMPICLVDGCNSDFGNCREYHKRHKVCEVHSKTPVVTINGHKQRFCQQCSRFHSLEEFDEGKRSCRKRLDGHNRRRRKPRPDHMARPANFFTGFQGSRLLEFSGGSHVFPTTSVANPSRGNGLVSVATASGSSYEHNHQGFSGSSPPAKTGLVFPISSSLNSRGKQFPFLQEQESSRTASLCERMTACVHDSDCALSLLSSSYSSVPHLLHHQPPLSLPQEAVGTVFYGSGLFENASAVSDGSVISGHEAVPLPQTFPFHWE